jgi:hypothetical protein
MSFSPASSDKLLSVYLALAQYPILSGRIRGRMRKLLFERELITPKAFEARVRETRQAYLRNQITDLIFSQRLPFSDLETIISEILSERGVDASSMLLSINPELAPPDLVFEHAFSIENMPAEDRLRFQARLEESKVVLIRTLISDQLRYINIAKEWFTISDLAEIRRRKIGTGRVGGKAAGMLLAYRVLKEAASEELVKLLHIPESYYIGADVMYTFMSINNLGHWNDQKYKSEGEMRHDYAQVIQEHEAGVFPPDILESLQNLVVSVAGRPMIVRSSSLLEDNFGTSFAGKYMSIFLPNQGTPEQNFNALTLAIARIYGSTLNPNALLYRRAKGLQDYDERMAILIQVVQGEKVGRYFLPHAAGVAFSRNLYRWAPQIRREDGFVRLVWGLGTRAVDRVGNDYPRLIALSHPLLRPSSAPKAIRRYSQQYVDLLDLEDNTFKTLPIHDVLSTRYPPLRYLAQVDEDGYFVSMRSSLLEGDHRRLTLTFEDLLRRTAFAEQMSRMLKLLERGYKSPVDMEFTISLSELQSSKPQVDITILQCRPQSHLAATERMAWPTDLTPEDIFFSTFFVVPQGYIQQVDYIVYVPAEAYFALPSMNDRFELGRSIGRLNAAMKGKSFICIGPGRWGSSNPELGVPIDYGDIYNAKALVEMAGAGIGAEPEPSLGTHFFQDLIESQIFPLAVTMDDPRTVFHGDELLEAPERLGEFILVDERFAGSLRLVKVSDLKECCRLSVIMDDERGQALAYYVPLED